MSEQGSAALRVEGLCVRYAKTRVVHDVSFDVRPGEIFGLIGLNGAGKTTIIKTVIGLRTPECGSTFLSGGDPSDPVARRALAYLPERFDPPWFLTGVEFLKFSLRLYGRTYEESAILEGAQGLALDPASLRRRVQTLSKGMRQKLGLLATVLTGAPVLILDEPMSGLDPLARARVKSLLTSCRAEGRTVFLSSHILSDLTELCDRVAVLHEGRIVFCGAPGALISRESASSLEQAFLSAIGVQSLARSA